MSSTQLQQLMAQVEQLTLVNNKLQQELSSNSSHIARLESAMQLRRGIKPSEDDAGASWSQTSSVRSSRSGDGGTPVPHPNSAKPAELAKNMPHGPMKIDNTGLVHQLPSNERDSPPNTQPVLWQHRPAPRQQERQQDSRERRDSGSCDHTESELNGMVFRDVSTNTPSTQEVHFARLPELDNAVGPGVVSSDRHGNELVTIGTQTTEVVMSAECAYEPSVENVRGCSKAATPQQLSDFYHGAWPIVDGDVSSSNSGAIQETQSVMSFHSSISSHSSRPSHHYKDTSNKDGSSKGANQLSGLAGQTIAESHSAPIALQPLITGGQPLGTKVQMVYSLISMLGTHDPEDMSQTLLAMSSSPDSCIAMRQSGCLPLLVQLIYGSESEKEALTAGKLCRARACQALHNIIHSPPDDKRSRRELKLLKYIEIVQSHCESIRGDKTEDKSLTEAADKIWPPSDIDRNPGPAVAALMKLSFDDHCRPPIVELGGLPCMAQLIKLDQASYSANSDLQRITMRRYACMTLTNLTFGDCNNKARLCAMQSCLNAIVLQLQAFNEDLCQVAASVIRNLSWKADQASKRHLRVSSATTKLMITAIQVKRESTLKSILSALWNLSAHCTYNKTCICEVDGSIEFLVGMLSYQSPTKTPAIVECAGGILRNISSVIAVRDDYRKILRAHNALKILLSHLKSPSMTVVGNACGALWNISARCAEDQQTLIELGALHLLKNLTNSKHRLVALGSSATIKNLMQFKTEGAKSGGSRSKHSSSSKKSTAGSSDTPLTMGDLQSFTEPAQSPSKHLQHESCSSSTELTTKVQRADSQDSVGSCSSLTSREGLTTLSRIEQLMQDVIHANMEIHQTKYPLPTTSTHSSDTRLNSGSSTPRTKPLSSVSKTSEYSLSHFPNNLSANRQISSLSPRVSNVRGAHIPSPGLANMQYYMGHAPSYPPPEDKFSVRSVSSSTEEPAAAVNFNMTYNDDNIDNSSEKPVDYSQMYQESSGYERQASVSHNADAAASFNTSLPRPVGQLPSALLHHDPAVLLQTSSGSFLDPSYFHAPIPTLSEIKAQAMVEKARDSAAIRAPPSGPRAMTDLSRIEDHHGEDQVRTFCTEGTPMNFLSTATSMNEINKIGEEPIPEQDEPTSLSHTNKSVSSQGNTTHSAMLRANLPKEGSLPSALKPSHVPRPTLPEVEDEAPRTYATEDTPITGISRVGSLSSLTSGAEGKPAGSGVIGAELGKDGAACPPSQGALERIHEDEVLSSAPAYSKPPPKTPVEQKTVSFDDHTHIQETPMMFSRASSLASLSSCDQHSIHSSVFSEYSCRRASQVVSPSDLPDSPGGTTPQSPTTRRKAKQTGANTNTQPSALPAKQVLEREGSMPSQSLDMQTNKKELSQVEISQFQPISAQPASTESEAVTNLLGLSGMFGSLSGLISVQEPSPGEDVDTSAYGYNHIPNTAYHMHSNIHYQQQYNAGMGVAYPYHPAMPPPPYLQYGSLPQQQYAAIRQPLPAHTGLNMVPLATHSPTQPGVTNNTAVYGTLQQVPLANDKQHPHNSNPHFTSSQPMSSDTHQQIVQGTNQQVHQGSAHTTQQVASASPDTKEQVPSSSASTKPTGSVDMKQKCLQEPESGVSLSSIGRNKVDQFLTDTMRTYAVEGTPGPNSTRSSLSALTFLDEPAVPRASISLLKSSLSKSKEADDDAVLPPPKLPAKRGNSKQQPTSSPSKASPNKPLDLSLKPKTDATAALATHSNTEEIKPESSEVAPPVPPKPAHLVGKRSESVASSSPVSTKSNSEKSPGGASKPVTSSRSSNNSESRNDSDSSSDGDDFMLQQCISSAMPSSRKKMAKSSSDTSVPTAHSRAANRSVPRSKTFGSRLRMPSKKSIKAVQLAKQRQAPPIVSANSPTPDDDYFAEEAMMTYCTEDTPYNKSTATSLSDLSVIDDDDFDSAIDTNPSMPVEGLVKTESTSRTTGYPPQSCEGKVGAEASESDSSTSDDEATSSMLNNAILSALPKKSGKGSVTSMHSSQALKCTSSELRATDIKYQTSGDSVRNYATEGTPHNFSTNTSLSDLTVDSHYSTSKTPVSQYVSDTPIGQSKQTVNQSAKQISQLSKRPSSSHTSTRTGLASRIPQATSSSAQRASTATPAKQHSSSSSPQHNRVSTMPPPPPTTSDEMKSFGVEGTPFNYSRRESLSSLSCDEDDEMNMTVVNCVTDAMAKRLQEKQLQSRSPQKPSTENSGNKSGGIATSAASQRPTVEFKDDMITTFKLPPPSDGLNSRDEVTKAYTPIEGTPYCFSRNSPLSSLSGSDCDSDAGEAGASATVSSIAEAHRAEGGGVSDTSESEDDTFLDHCISSALPKKLVNSTQVSKVSAKSPESKSSNFKQGSAGMASLAPPFKVPSQTLPKQVDTKPPPVSLLPASGEIVVAQRTPSRGMSAETSTDSLKQDSAPHKTTAGSPKPSTSSGKTNQEKKDERELRRKTYTVTESQLQSALALLPSCDTSQPSAGESAKSDSQSNIVISGDEDEFDDVYMFENGELFKEDIDAVLEALKHASEEVDDALNPTFMSLPEPPACFADDYDAPRSESINHGSSLPKPARQTLCGPRITKPDNSGNTDTKEPEVKVVRGRRKPLYPGKTSCLPSTRSPPARKPVSSTGATKATGIARVNSKSSDSVSQNWKSPSHKKLASTGIPKAPKSVSKKSSPVSSSNKRADSSESQHVAHAPPHAPPSVSRKVTPKAAGSNLSNKSAATTTGTTKSKHTANSKKSMLLDKQVKTTSTAELKAAHDENSDDCETREKILSPAAGCEDRGRVLSPSDVLHRAAGGTSTRPVNTPAKPDTPRPIASAKSTLRTDTQMKRCKQPTTRPPGKKSEAVSKIASLWKPSSAADSPRTPQHKPKLQSSLTVQSKLLKPKSDANRNRKSPAKSDGDSVPEYVVAISFRETNIPAAVTVTKESPPSDSLNTDTCEQAPLPILPDTDSFKDSSCESASHPSRHTSVQPDSSVGSHVSADALADVTTTQQSSTPSKLVPSVGEAGTENKLGKQPKNSAIVSPFLYKPTLPKTPSTNTASAQSAVPSSTDILSANILSSTHTPHSNHIKLCLDITPHITLSQVSPKPANLNESNDMVAAEHAAEHAGDVSASHTPLPAMTKTEMLLRRRSEILHKRRLSECNALSSLTPTFSSKTTDV